MSKYERLDATIIAAISEGRSPLYAKTVNAEADKLASVSGREGFRIIDGRLQALRKAGRIGHDSKLGWRIRFPDGGYAPASVDKPVHGVGHMQGRGAA